MPQCIHPDCASENMPKLVFLCNYHKDELTRQVRELNILEISDDLKNFNKLNEPSFIRGAIKTKTLRMIEKTLIQLYNKIHLRIDEEKHFLETEQILKSMRAALDETRKDDNNGFVDDLERLTM